MKWSEIDRGTPKKQPNSLLLYATTASSRCCFTRDAGSGKFYNSAWLIREFDGWFDGYDGSFELLLGIWARNRGYEHWD